MTIVDQHHEKHGVDEPLVLQPSEAHRLREDLRYAHSALELQTQQLVQLSELIERHQGALDRAMTLAESYKQLNAKTTDIARRAVALVKDNGYTTRPYRPADRPGEETLADFSRRA